MTTSDATGDTGTARSVTVAGPSIESVRSERNDRETDPEREHGGEGDLGRGTHGSRVRSAALDRTARAEPNAQWSDRLDTVGEP